MKIILKHPDLWLICTFNLLKKKLQICLLNAHLGKYRLFQNHTRLIRNSKVVIAFKELLEDFHQGFQLVQKYT